MSSTTDEPAVPAGADRLGQLDDGMEQVLDGAHDSSIPNAMNRSRVTPAPLRPYPWPDWLVPSPVTGSSAPTRWTGRTSRTASCCAAVRAWKAAL